MRDSAIIYRSFYEAIKELPVDVQATVWQAICEYSLNFELIELDGIGQTVFRLIRPQLDANLKRYANGSKPKLMRTGSKVPAKPKQAVSETVANDNNNNNDNVNANGNGNGKTTAKAFVPPTILDWVTFFKENEILNLINEGKFMTSWQAVLAPDTFENMIGALTPTVGASGAIYGLLVAFAFMFPNAELALLFIPVPIKAKYFVPGIVLLDLFSGVTGYSIFGGGIAHFAHVGGALFGFIMMWYWKKNQFNQNRWDK
jgi:hypothetical protein